MIFISYSRKDRELLDEFMVHLKPLFGKENILWIDEKVRPGQKWDEEIKNALKACKVGVMLISPTFLSSEYINNEEIPVLLNRAENEQITLTSVFLRESVVDKVAFTIEVDGEERKIKLTAYQGLNTPNSPIAKMQSHDRDKAFREAAVKLKSIEESLYRTSDSDHKANPSPHSAQHQLAVTLYRSSENLYRNFYSRGNSIGEIQTKWHHRIGELDDWIHNQACPAFPDKSGDLLFDILFGGLDEQGCRELLKKAWQQEEANNNPTRYPLRVKIYTEDSILSQLPWHKSTWMGQKLVDHGWTFESIAVPPSDDYVRTGLHIRTPLSVSLILPDSGDLASRAGNHYENLVDCFNRIWAHTSFNKPPRFSQWQTFCTNNSTRPGEFVYFYGSVEAINGRLFLDVPDQKINLMEFRTALAIHPISKVVFLNLCCDDSTEIHESLREFSKNFPLVIVQIFLSHQHLAAESAVIDWMQTVLERGIDPVRAINECGIDRATVWANYERWEAVLGIDTKPVRHDLAKLLLDRHRQRETVSKTSLDALHNPETRVIATVACGESSDWLDLFHQQIRTTLRSDLKSRAVVHQTELRFPTSVKAPEDVQEGLYRALAESMHQKLRSICEKQLSKAPRDSKILWILHWEPQGAALGRKFGEDRFHFWERFCRERLAAECPERIRILCLLPLESKEPDKVRTLVDKRKRDYGNRAYHFFELDPLSRVGEDDLGAFLQRREIQCPDDLLNCLPGLIFRHSGGLFNKSVGLLEEGLSRGWRLLHGKLTESEPESPQNIEEGLSI